MYKWHRCLFIQIYNLNTTTCPPICQPNFSMLRDEMANKDASQLLHAMHVLKANMLDHVATKSYL
jgi:hypothetical protein